MAIKVLMTKTKVNLGDHIQQPESEKLHQIIEKTALFIVRHGLQMEIVMKTKQKNNPLFSFLLYDHPLNAYYKHFVEMIREGRYTPRNRQSADDEDMSKENIQIEKPLSSQEFLDSVKLKLPSNQIANTPYALLLEKLKKHVPKPAPPRPTPPKPLSPKPSKHQEQQIPQEGPQNQPLPLHGPQNQDIAQLQQAPPPEDSYSSHQNETDKSSHPQQNLSPIQLSNHHSSCPSPSNLSIQHPPPPDVKVLIDKLAVSVARVGIEFELVLKQRNDPRFTFLDSSHVWNAYYLQRKNLLLKEKSMENKTSADTSTASTTFTNPSTTSSTTPSNTTISSTDIRHDKTIPEKESRSKQDSPNNIKSIKFSIKKDETTAKKSFTRVLQDMTDDDDGEEKEDGDSNDDNAAIDEGEKKDTKHTLPHAHTTCALVGVQEVRKKKVEKFVNMLRRNLSQSTLTSTLRDTPPNQSTLTSTRETNSHRNKTSSSLDKSSSHNNTPSPSDLVKSTDVHFEIGPQNKPPSDDEDRELFNGRRVVDVVSPTGGGSSHAADVVATTRGDKDIVKDSKPRSKKSKRKHIDSREDRQEKDSKRREKKRRHKRSKSRSISRSKRKNSRSRNEYRSRRDRTNHETASRSHRSRDVKKRKHKHRDDDDDNDDIKVIRVERSRSSGDEHQEGREKKKRKHQHKQTKNPSGIEEVVDLTLD